MERYKPIAWLPGAPANTEPSRAFPSPKAQRAELARIEAACATIGDPAADEAALRASFLAIGSALCTERQRTADLHRRVSDLEADMNRILKRAS